jgi:hypothetical protein
MPVPGVFNYTRCRVCDTSKMLCMRLSVISGGRLKIILFECLISKTNGDFKWII